MSEFKREERYIVVKLKHLAGTVEKLPSGKPCSAD